MKSYNTEWIRNVGIVGHGDTGKTQLVSSLLFTAGMTPRLGKVSDGSTVTDWDEEEIARKISINTGLAFVEWLVPGQSEKTKINLLDAPGYSTFINETKSSLIAADASLILVDAAAGVQVVTEKVWDYATEYDQPRSFVINWMDRELASFERTLDSLQKVFGRGVVPIQLRKRSSTRPMATAKQKSRKFPQTSPKKPRPRTKRSSKWSPKATTL